MGKERPFRPADDGQAFAARLGSVRKWYGQDTGRPWLDRGEFATDLGLEAETYRRYERGETEPPIWILASIRRLTRVSLDLLIAGLHPGEQPDLSAFPPDAPDKPVKKKPKMAAVPKKAIAPKRDI